jgi:hypothetical protein
MDSERFDALTKSLAASTSRRGVLKIALGAALGGLFGSRFAPPSNAAGRTSVGLTNGSSQPVDVYVTLKGNDTCTADVTQIAGWGVAKTTDALHGKVTLQPGATLPAFDGGSTCFAATISFGSLPLNCPTAAFPCATNLMEFFVNGPGKNDDLDISEVAGANSKIQVSLSGGSWWDGFNRIPGDTFGTDGTLARQSPLALPGVYPWGCDNCTIRCQPGQDYCAKNGSPNNLQGACNAKANCDIVPMSGGSAGGTVTISYMGPSACNPPAANCGALNNPCCGGTGGSAGTCNSGLVCNPGGICQKDVGACPGKTCSSDPTCVTCGSAGTTCCAPPSQCQTCGIAKAPCCPSSSIVNPCTDGNICVNNTCAPCGAGGQPCCTGSMCGTGFVCGNNTCSACGAGGQPCCAGNTCASDLFVCVSSTNMCQACGAATQPCCAGNTCPRGGTCQGGQCVVGAQAAASSPSASACGLLGQPCCAGNTCTDRTNLCVGGTCLACGGPSQPCCLGNVCASGTCNNGKCADPTAASCGAVGQPCCLPGNTCDSSANTCIGGLCMPATKPAASAGALVPGTGDWVFPNMHP